MSGAAKANADVAALVQAAGGGSRLGLGPKAFLTLAGRTLLERAIDAMSAVTERVIAGVPADHVDGARVLCGGRARIIAGGGTRIETLLALVRTTTAPLLLLHDVVHPFVSPGLCLRVIEAARAHGAASAVVPCGSSAYHHPLEAGPARLPPGGLWLTRKPMAFRRDVFEQGLARLGDRATSAGEIIAAAVRVPVLVPSEPWNIKVTTPDDWTLAQVIATWLASTS